MGVYNLGSLYASQARVNALMADFSGLKDLDDIVDKVLERLKGKVANGAYAQATSGAMSKESFDMYFAELIRVELGKTLAIVRANAIRAAERAGAGSASSAVLRRMYKNQNVGNINIAQPNRRVSSRTRIVPAPDGGRSGIRRVRTVGSRTKSIREYYGPDRGFILRILEGGRDVFYARPENNSGRGSKATYGRRGAMAPRNWFFHQIHSDMEQAAQRLGQTLVGAVENYVNQEFSEQ